MKKLSKVIIIMGIFLSTLIPNPQSLSAATNEIRIIINNELIPANDAKPYIDKSNRTMVPVRVVSDNLGAKVDWNPTKKAFQVIGVHAKTKDVITIIGVANNPRISVNGVNKYLDPSSKDVVVVVKDGRTYVPLRFFGEELGYEVSYKNRVVYITTPGNPVVELPEIPKVDGEVKFTDGMDKNKFIKDIPKTIPTMTTSQAGNQAHLGTNGNAIIVSETNPYSSNDNGYLFNLTINGWNTPGQQVSSHSAKKNAETMKTMKKVFSLYTTEHEKVYNAFNDAIVKDKPNGTSITTKDGRTFSFYGESSGIIVRIK